MDLENVDSANCGGSAKEQLDMVLPGGWKDPINNKDYEGKVMCEAFESHRFAKAAGLTKAELAMLRMYTG
eukprot:2659858-Rhodomonas_salina.1